MYSSNKTIHIWLYKKILRKKILKLLYNYLFTFGKNIQKAYDLKHLKKTPCSRIQKKKSNVPCCRTKKESSIQRFCLHITLNTIKWLKSNEFSSVQFTHTVVSNYANSWTAAHQASLCITNSWS